eukprot:gene24805-30219_t
MADRIRGGPAQICAGATEDSSLAELELGSPRLFDLLYSSARGRIEAIAAGEREAADLAEYWQLRKSLTECGVRAEVQQRLLRVWAAILHLGNLREDQHAGSNAAELETIDRVQHVAKLLELETSSLAALLCLSSERLQQARLPRDIARRSSSLESVAGLPVGAQTLSQVAIDAFAKTLYALALEWVLEALNQAGAPQ